MGEFKHGHSKRSGRTRTYQIWKSMRKRCNNPNTEFYYCYGARGIKVCERWDSYANFLADMGECQPGLSIERIDNDANYEPSNCRWASTKEQSRNQRGNRHITHNGETLTLVEWEEKLGLPNHCLASRLSRGWNEITALTTPVIPWTTITYKGETRTVKEWAKELGFKVATVRGRLDRGWDIDRLMTQTEQVKRCQS